MSIKAKMMVTFSIVTIVIWIATIVYTFPTVNKLLQMAAAQGDYATFFSLFKRNILFCGTAGTLFSIFVGYLMARFILGPMTQVIQAMQEVAQGNLTVTVSSNTGDELDILCNTFNHMAKEFNSYVTKMEEAALEIAEVAGKLNENVEQATRATEEIAQTIQSVAAATDNQNSTIKNTSQLFEHMADGVKQVAARAKDVSAASNQAAALSEKGSTTITKAVQQMETISQTVNLSAQTVIKLGERSKEIGLILDSITSIAEQTNLLALNAAIEAARAGEQGRGFAVVADEVRKLAEQSSAAARQITELIQLIQQETQQAVRSMESGTVEVDNGIKAVTEAGNAFSNILQVIKQVTGQMAEVSAASQQMAASSQQAVDAIGQIAQISQQTTASAQEVSASAEELTAIFHEGEETASKLHQMSSELMVMVRKIKKAKEENAAV